MGCSLSKLKPPGSDFCAWLIKQGIFLRGTTSTLEECVTLGWFYRSHCQYTNRPETEKAIMELVGSAGTDMGISLLPRPIYQLDHSRATKIKTNALILQIKKGDTTTLEAHRNLVLDALNPDGPITGNPFLQDMTFIPVGRKHGLPDHQIADFIYQQNYYLSSIREAQIVGLKDIDVEYEIEFEDSCTGQVDTDPASIREIIQAYNTEHGNRLFTVHKTMVPGTIRLLYQNTDSDFAQQFIHNFDLWLEERLLLYGHDQPIYRADEHVKCSTSAWSHKTVAIKAYSASITSHQDAHQVPRAIAIAQYSQAPTNGKRKHSVTYSAALSTTQPETASYYTAPTVKTTPPPSSLTSVVSQPTQDTFNPKLKAIQEQMESITQASTENNAASTRMKQELDFLTDTMANVTDQLTKVNIDIATLQNGMTTMITNFGNMQANFESKFDQLTQLLATANLVTTDDTPEPTKRAKLQLKTIGKPRAIGGPKSSHPSLGSQH